MKKEELVTNDSVVECRLHMWEVASKAISNKAVQGDLLRQVSAFIFVYRDEVLLGQSRNLLDNSRLTSGLN